MGTTITAADVKRYRSNPYAIASVTETARGFDVRGRKVEHRSTHATIEAACLCARALTEEHLGPVNLGEAEPEHDFSALDRAAIASRK